MRPSISQIAQRLASSKRSLSPLVLLVLAGSLSHARGSTHHGKNVLGDGIWINRGDLRQRPTSGEAWQNLISAANQPCGAPELNDQEQSHDTCVLAKGLVFARTGKQKYRDDVILALRQVAESGPYVGRALALGRNLVGYVVAADLIGLKECDSRLDRAFREKLRELLAVRTEPGPKNLVECHERRPNNWGTHCGASRAAVAAYLGDEEELARTANVFRGWLGDRTAHRGFVFGDLSWQCDPAEPTGINRLGCTRDGLPLGGAQPEEMRRAGLLHWPPAQENYAYEALQGALVQAVILSRAGYPAFEWENKALLRAFEWLNIQARFPPRGDDRWLVHLVNRFYRTHFPADASVTPGKNMGWTDWTHSNDPQQGARR